MNKNKLRFEVLIILTIGVVFGLVGMYIWCVKSTTNMTTIKSNDGFSFSYPSNWNVATYGNPLETATSGATNSGWIIMASKVTGAANGAVNNMCVNIDIQANNSDGNVFKTGLGKIITRNNDKKLEIWRANDKSSYPSSPGAGPDAVSILQTPGKDDVVLPNGKALIIFASYFCAQNTTSTYSYDQQVASPDYQTGINILKSVSIN